jgi:putrescine aminotransferase
LRRATEKYGDLVVDVRGRGLLMAIEFIDHRTGFDLAKLLLDRGVLVSGTLVNARVIRIEPPLTIEESQADYVCRCVEESLAAMTQTATTGV